ncbi:hypothetical protein TUSST3_01780 [Streptomyces sp. TUS-ST3]|nr:hypothetical protein TUSST3_01780 [Streptomyces sp. TUS-ST3]
MRQEAEAEGRSCKAGPFMSRLSCFQPYEWYGAVGRVVRRAPYGTFGPVGRRLTRSNGLPRTADPAVAGLSTSRDGCDGARSHVHALPVMSTPSRFYRALVTTVKDE